MSTLGALLFGELYSAASVRAWMPSWIVIGLINSAISVALLVLNPKMRAYLDRRRASGWAWLPALAILIGSFVLALTSQTPRPARPIAWTYFVGSCTWIPVVEEIVFRGGVSPLFRRVTNPLWSAYFSSLVFAFAHNVPTFYRLVRLDVGIPLGPFLLGLCCEGLVFWTRSLWPGIAFHCACNATVLVFTLMAPGWLDRLSWLYS